MGVFVGRSAEQETFLQVLANAALKSDAGPDAGHVVLVQGYGGIGKSTLLNRFADLAAMRDVRVCRLDWETDARRHPEDYIEFSGPVIWRVLARIDAEIDHCARSSWSSRDRRRAAQRFAPFRRQVASLPELERQAEQLGLAHLLGRTRANAKQISEAMAEVANEAAAGLGVPDEAAGVAKAGVGGLGAAVSTWLDRQVDPEKYAALLDRRDALVRTFAEGVRALAGPHPLVIVLDTCELLGGTHALIRDVVARSGRRVIWVIGMRLEPEQLASESSEIVAYTRDIDGRRLRLINLARFDDATALGYLTQQLGHIPAELTPERVAALTHGVPLALRFLSDLVADQAQQGRPLTDLVTEITPDGTVSAVIARMAERYLIHASREGSELRRDLPALYGLALMYTEQDTSQLYPTSQPNGEFDHPEPTHSRRPADGWSPVAVAHDAALLGVLWDMPSERASARLDELGRRHDFVHSLHGTIHRDVRDAIRLFLHTPVRRAAVVDINSRARAHFANRLVDFGHKTIDDQFSDPAWRTAVIGLLWHTYWVSPDDGFALLRHLFAPAWLLERNFARTLTAISSDFAAELRHVDREDLHRLKALPVPRRDRPGTDGLSYRAVIQRLSSPVAAPRLLAGSSEPYFHLLRADNALPLGLDLVARVAELQRAAALVPPASGPTADRIGTIANDLLIHDLPRQPIAVKDALLEARILDARYRPRDGYAQVALGGALLACGRLGEAGAAFRAGIRVNPRHAQAHHGLGCTFIAKGKLAEAEEACREAHSLDPHDTLIMNALGCVLLELGQLHEAERLFRQGLDLDHEDADIHSNLGETLLWAKRIDEARESLRTAVGLEPHHPGANYLLGLIGLADGSAHAADHLSQSDSGCRAELVRWTAARADNAGIPGAPTPRSLLAALDRPWPVEQMPLSLFARDEIRALAFAGLGDADKAARTLRGVVPQRTPADRFLRPIYDLLARPTPVAGLDALLQTWREIVAENPAAAGPWGGPA